MNTINAAGYLAGALLPLTAFQTLWLLGYGAWRNAGQCRLSRCAQSPVISSYSAWRASLQGFPPLPVSSRAARLAARILKSRPERASFLLSHSPPDRDSHDPLAIDA
jgi:hypothetical protein